VTASTPVTFSSSEINLNIVKDIHIDRYGVAGRDGATGSTGDTGFTLLVDTYNGGPYKRGEIVSITNAHQHLENIICGYLLISIIYNNRYK
jgi:hypothetical protein